ncbi:MAG: Gfo/Idh/MocA family protein [Pseudomonadales bacterium]
MSELSDDLSEELGSELCFGVVGYGNIGRTHVATLASGAVKRARVSSVVARGDADLPDGVKRHATLDDLLAANEVDAVIVATPTMTHPSVGLAVLAARRHLVMEKPVAMSVQEVQQLVAAVPDGIHAAAMLNQRYHPFYRKIKTIIASGELGRIVRFNWIMTAWYRPDVYFLVSPWRGTWQGEGGGALLNQCIHNLDVLQWLLGLPESVVADIGCGKFHDIEVEDEVSAILSYPDGASGVLVASTGEAPGMNRFDIVGDRGTLRFDGETLTLLTSDQSVSEHCASTREMFSLPEFRQQDISVGTEDNQHACVLQDLVDAVLDGKPLATQLSEGVGSVELANAILLSAWEDRRVKLPLDAGRYQSMLDERIASSGLREPLDINVDIDMEASYR